MKKRTAMRTVSLPLAAIVVLFGVVILPACSLNVKDQTATNGSKKVDITSPLGDMHVSEDVKNQDFGVPVYPGARRREDGKDKHGADVNMAFGGFGLKVVAAEFESDDSPNKLLAYYRNELKKYGKVLECQGGSIDAQDNFSDDDSKGSHELKCDQVGDGKSGKQELKVGTKENQHVVGVEPQGKGTRFGIAFVQVHTKGGEI